MPQDFVTADLPCAWCGYNLRMLSVAARCPECGRPVAKSTLPFPKSVMTAAALRRIGWAPIVNFIGLVLVLTAGLRETVVFRGTITKFTPEAVTVLVGASELWASLYLLAASLALAKSIPTLADSPLFARMRLLRRAAAVRSAGTVLLVANMLWLAKVSGGRTIAGWHVALPLFGLVQTVLLAQTAARIAPVAGRADLGSRLTWIARLESILLLGLLVASALIMASGGGLFDIFTHAREIVSGLGISLLLPLVWMVFVSRELADAVAEGPRSVAQVALRESIRTESLAALEAPPPSPRVRSRRPARPKRVRVSDALRTLARTPRRLLGEPLAVESRRLPRRLLGR